MNDITPDRRASDRMPANTQISAAEGLSMLAIHDTATRALFAIEFHSGECDKRQLRIEKSQDETKTAVAVVDSKVSASTNALHTKIDTFAKEVNTKIEVSMTAVNEKINGLNLKIAAIIGGLLLLREMLAAYFHHT